MEEARAATAKRVHALESELQALHAAADEDEGDGGDRVGGGRRSELLTHTLSAPNMDPFACLCELQLRLGDGRALRAISLCVADCIRTARLVQVQAHRVRTVELHGTCHLMGSVSTNPRHGLQAELCTSTAKYEYWYQYRYSCTGTPLTPVFSASSRCCTKAARSVMGGSSGPW